MFSFRKTHLVTTMVEAYMDHCDACVASFTKGFTEYLETGPNSAFCSVVREVDRLESECDKDRRTIEEAMFAKALIPESRADVLKLIEAVDDVPDLCEHICYDVQNEHLRVPESCVQSFRDLAFLSEDCCGFLSKAVRTLFTDLPAVRAFVDKVGKKESESDVLRRELVHHIFSDPAIAPDQRILLRDLAEKISCISDHCETVGDILIILTVKRLV